MFFSKKIKQFKSEWKSLKDWPNVPRRWTKFKKITQISLFIVGIAITFIPTFFQQYSILKVYEGLTIPNGTSYIYLNFSDASNVQISLPYKVENDGFYNLLDVNLEISLKLKYTNKNTGEITQQTILSESSGLKNVLVSNTLNETFHKDYMAFDWGNIGTYNDDVDTAKEVVVLMGLVISFYLEGIERDYISYIDMDLSSEVAEISSSSINFAYNDFKSTLIIHSSNIPTLLILVFTMISLFAVSLGILKSRKKKKNRNVARQARKKRLKQDPIYKNNLKLAIQKVIIYTSIVLVWDSVLIFSQLNTSMEGINTGDYNFRYIIALTASIMILICINVITLLPAINPKKYARYSPQKGLTSLFISGLSTLNIFFWAITAIVIYNIGDVAVVVRDTFPSFIPIIILLIIQISIKVVDLMALRKYKNHFNIVRNKKNQEMMTKREADKRKPANARELNILIFQAIKQLKDNASWSEIIKYFGSIQKAKVTLTGEKLNKQYLENLINQLYLIKRKEKIDVIAEGQDNKKRDIYYLTPLASNLLKEIESDEYIDVEIDGNRLTQCPHCDTLSIIINGRCPTCERII